MERYNLIVLGAGSGGLTVAGGAALLGARVALLEKHRMGGDCLNYGCVGSWSCDVDTVPWTTFTDPAVARVGLSEAQTRERGVRYDVFTTPFDDNDRALCDGEPEGFVKVLT